ncbi:MAG: cupredoxin domain-containing protein [Halobacteriales archaeon]|nr:cupredoxin domain-containing protein [Halobacteriales archaeon]
MLRPSCAALLAVACLALAGCSSSSPPTATNTSDATHLDLVDNKYQPEEATFKADQAAHFQNKGTRDHTVTIHDEAGHVLHDKTLKPGETDEFKFPNAGVYHVMCKFHNGMGAQLTLT